ncbi:hypothetical protein DENIS_0927 [Desulfonema ishimotonii]|uniref:Uncharacterized protein n=1 Tax=Desulfonema ishimotonii TaxID=45657 RepID=A0A401FSQ1_9BACT|nr:hypothetical protein [Desulfonema ishimotonii]GBC59985.1 hypothetical protein DENIS_0927 [Desulfonema ishimotonii]
MKRFLILLVLTLTAIWLPAAESISGSFDAGDLELTNVNIDDNGDIVPGAGSPVTDPERIVIPFTQEVRAAFVYEGAGYISDFGWMLYEDAADTDGNFRGWNNIPADKKHALFVKIRDDAEGSGCCNGGNGILDTDRGHGFRGYRIPVRNAEQRHRDLADGRRPGDNGCGQQRERQ